jgi:HlyD family secretion protein
MVAVNTAIAQVGTLETALAYTGTTQPFQLVALRSRVDGQVTMLTVDVGDAVGAGDALARLDADLLTVDVNQAEAELRARESEVAQAKAAVSDAQTALEAARVRLQQAQTDADRLSRLAADGAVSIQAAEQAQLTVDTGQQVLQSAAEQIRTRQEAVNAAEGRVNAQQAVVDQTVERLSYAVVRSPLAGVVIERFIETGDYAESGDELLHVGDLNRLKVMIEVSDRDLAQVSVGQPVDVQLDAFPNEPVAGRITRIAPAADPASRLIPVEVTIANERGRMGSGLLARVTFKAAGSDRVAIPKAAFDISGESATPTIFVLRDHTENEATVEARSLDIGRETNQQVEILSGLQPGEAFVTRSTGDLSDGQTVRLSILSETD